MPVQRFRGLEDAWRALWMSAEDPALSHRLRRLWSFSARLVPSTFPRGVRRFRTIEEANADREQHITARVRTLAAVRTRPV